MRTIILTCLILIGIAAVANFPWPAPKQDSRTVDKVIRPWLEAMRNGGDGFEYWRAGNSAGLPPRVSFFAVTDYEILGRSSGGYLVRIHSSTRGGSPIVAVYEVVATGSGLYRVTVQGEDPLAWAKIGSG